VPDAGAKFPKRQQKLLRGVFYEMPTGSNAAEIPTKLRHHSPA
jgi:hypothetical protein